MKRFLICLSLAAAVSSAQRFDFSIYDELLTKHVEAGRVDYSALQADQAGLNDFLIRAGKLSGEDFSRWPENYQLAFLINLYNAATLRLVLEHYPVAGIKEIGTFFKGPWDQPVVPMFGKTVTLNELEHGIIRKQYNEPRVHMALVCAAKGCPPLRSEAYMAEKLDKQLDDQSRRYLSGPAGLVVNPAKGEARISAIFKWYGRDFSSVPAFVEQYSGESIRGLKIRYLKYDWSLNER